MKIILYKEDKKFFTDKGINVSRVTVHRDRDAPNYRASYYAGMFKNYKTPWITNETTSRDVIMERLANELAKVIKGKS